MATQHTPGPWKLEPNSTEVFALKDEQAVQISKATKRGTENLSWEEVEANARLIAAAPDLLAALENIAELQSSNDYPHVKAEMTRNIARAAINKAKGG